MRPNDPLRSRETLATIQRLADDGIDRFCVILRHSERHYHPNPAMEPFMGLTDAGKEFAMDLGRALPADPCPSFFSSPFGRCIETACIMDKGYIRAHGRFNGHNTLTRELSPFYIRDTEKAVSLAREFGNAGFLRLWFDGKLPAGVMTDPKEAADTIAGFLLDRLRSLDGPRMTVCVSHDWNIYPLKEFKLGLRHEDAGSVGFLESVVVFEDNGRPCIAGYQKGPEPLG
jgi:broad specificity phosphatase PhoE